jgi:hypothetical protein
VLTNTGARWCLRSRRASSGFFRCAVRRVERGVGRTSECEMGAGEILEWQVASGAFEQWIFRFLAFSSWAVRNRVRVCKRAMLFPSFKRRLRSRISAPVFSSVAAGSSISYHDHVHVLTLLSCTCCKIATCLFPFALPDNSQIHSSPVSVADLHLHSTSHSHLSSPAWPAASPAAPPPTHPQYCHCYPSRLSRSRCPSIHYPYYPGRVCAPRGVWPGARGASVFHSRDARAQAAAVEARS